MNRFDAVDLETNNGSDCVAYLSNQSEQTITAVNIGAPQQLTFDNDSLFNGIHVLLPGEQLIAVGNFEGKQVNTLNLSPYAVVLEVLLYCPE
ncbi:MAG: hypothetical protein AAGB22_07155 [Bacteroidota bacterium]